MAMTNALLLADVMHTRRRPRPHQFRYSVYYLCFSLSEIEKLRRRFLSLNRWNLFSFYPKDHGARDGTNLEHWIRNILSRHNISEADGNVTLLTLPRVLGYVFNPVSFWFCFDKNGGLRAVLSEVSNTFGERHCYLSHHTDNRVIAPHDWLRAEKLFHVSPFLPVEGHYLFRFHCEEGRVHVNVNYHDEKGLMLATSVGGERAPLTTRHLLTCFFLRPLVTLKVIALIHGEALRLVLKGARYHPKPPPPTVEVSR